MAQRRNAYHQEYCTKPLCRKASRNRSRQKWLRYNRVYYIELGNGVKLPVRPRRPQPKHRRRSRRTRCLRIKIVMGWVKRGRAKRSFRVRIEYPQTGIYHDVFPMQLIVVARVLAWLESAIHDFIGFCHEERYIWRHVVQEAFAPVIPPVSPPATRGNHGKRKGSPAGRKNRNRRDALAPSGAGGGVLSQRD